MDNRTFFNKKWKFPNEFGRKHWKPPMLMRADREYFSNWGDNQYEYYQFLRPEFFVGDRHILTVPTKPYPQYKYHPNTAGPPYLSNVNHQPPAQVPNYVQPCPPEVVVSDAPSMPRKPRHSSHYSGFDRRFHDRNRRRSHLDDIFLPNYDIDEYEENEDGHHSYSNRRPVLTDVRIEDPDFSVKDNNRQSTNSSTGIQIDEAGTSLKDKKTVEHSECRQQEKTSDLSKQSKKSEISSNKESVPKNLDNNKLKSNVEDSLKKQQKNNSVNTAKSSSKISNNYLEISSISKEETKKIDEPVEISSKTKLIQNKNIQKDEQNKSDERLKATECKESNTLQKQTSINKIAYKKTSEPENAVPILSSSSQDVPCGTSKKSVESSGSMTDLDVSSVNSSKKPISMTLLTPEQKANKEFSTDHDIEEKTETLSDLMGAISKIDNDIIIIDEIIILDSPEKNGNGKKDMDVAPGKESHQKRKKSNSEDDASKKRKYSSDVEDILNKLDEEIDGIVSNEKEGNSEQVFQKVNDAFEDMFSEKPEKIFKRYRSKSFDLSHEKVSDLKISKSLNSLDENSNACFKDTTKDDLLAVLESQASNKFDDEAITISDVSDDDFLSDNRQIKAEKPENIDKVSRGLSSISEDSLDSAVSHSSSVRKRNIIESPIRIKQKNAQRIESSDSELEQIIFHKSKKARRILESSDEEFKSVVGSELKQKEHRHSHKKDKHKSKHKEKSPKESSKKHKSVKVSVPIGVMDTLAAHSVGTTKPSAKIKERRRTSASATDDSSKKYEKDLERKKLEKRVTSLFGSADVMHLTVDEEMNKKYEGKTSRRSSTESVKSRTESSLKLKKLETLCKPLTVSIQPLRNHSLVQRRSSAEKNEKLKVSISMDNVTNKLKVKHSKHTPVGDSLKHTKKSDGSIKKSSHPEKHSLSSKTTQHKSKNVEKNNVISKNTSIADITKQIIKSVISINEKSNDIPAKEDSGQKNPKKDEIIAEEPKQQIASEELARRYRSSFSNFEEKKQPIEAPQHKQLLENYKQKFGKQEIKGKPKIAILRPESELKLDIKKAYQETLRDDFDLCCYPFNHEDFGQLLEVTAITFVNDVGMDVELSINTQEIGKEPEIVKQKFKDEIVEIKPEIEVVDLTDDEIKHEKPEVTNKEFSEAITLYRDTQTTDSSVDCQAVVASIDADTWLNSNPKKIYDSAFKVEKKEELTEEQQVTASEQFTPIATVEESNMARLSHVERESPNNLVPPNSVPEKQMPTSGPATSVDRSNITSTTNDTVSRNLEIQTNLTNSTQNGATSNNLPQIGVSRDFVTSVNIQNLSTTNSDSRNTLSQNFLSSSDLQNVNSSQNKANANANKMPQISKPAGSVSRAPTVNRQNLTTTNIDTRNTLPHNFTSRSELPNVNSVQNEANANRVSHTTGPEIGVSRNFVTSVNIQNLTVTVTDTRNTMSQNSELHNVNCGKFRTVSSSNFAISNAHREVTNRQNVATSQNVMPMNPVSQNITPRNSLQNKAVPCNTSNTSNNFVPELPNVSRVTDNRSAKNSMSRLSVLQNITVRNSTQNEAVPSNTSNVYAHRMNFSTANAQNMPTSATNSMSQISANISNPVYNIAPNPAPHYSMPDKQSTVNVQNATTNLMSHDQNTPLRNLTQYVNTGRTTNGPPCSLGAQNQNMNTQRIWTTGPLNSNSTQMHNNSNATSVVQSRTVDQFNTEPPQHNLQRAPARMAPNQKDRHLQVAPSNKIETSICDIFTEYTYTYWVLTSAEKMYENFLERYWRREYQFHSIHSLFSTVKSFQFERLANEMYQALVKLHWTSLSRNFLNFFGRLAVIVSNNMKYNSSLDLSPIKIAIIMKELMGPYWDQYKVHDYLMYLCNALVQILNLGQARTNRNPGIQEMPYVQNFQVNGQNTMTQLPQIQNEQPNYNNIQTNLTQNRQQTSFSNTNSIYATPITNTSTVPSNYATQSNSYMPAPSNVAMRPPPPPYSYMNAPQQPNFQTELLKYLMTNTENAKRYQHLASGSPQYRPNKSPVRTRQPNPNAIPRPNAGTYIPPGPNVSPRTAHRLNFAQNITGGPNASPRSSHGHNIAQNIAPSSNDGAYTAPRPNPNQCIAPSPNRCTYIASSPDSGTFLAPSPNSGGYVEPSPAAGTYVVPAPNASPSIRPGATPYAPTPRGSSIYQNELEIEGPAPRYMPGLGLAGVSQRMPSVPSTPAPRSSPSAVRPSVTAARSSTATIRPSLTATVPSASKPTSTGSAPSTSTTLRFILPKDVPSAPKSDFRIKLPYTQPNSATCNQPTFSMSSVLLLGGSTTITTPPGAISTASRVDTQVQAQASYSTAVNSNTMVTSASGSPQKASTVVSALLLASPQNVVVIESSPKKDKCPTKGSPVATKKSASSEEIILIEDDDIENAHSEENIGPSEQEPNEVTQIAARSVLEQYNLRMEQDCPNADCTRQESVEGSSNAVTSLAAPQNDERGNEECAQELPNNNPGGNQEENRVSSQEEVVLLNEESPAQEQESGDGNEDTTDVIDLTWMDEIELEEIEDAFSFVVKKEEPPDDEYGQRTSAISPTDSGVGSPGPQGEHTIVVHKACICDKVAVYSCQCHNSWYCSESCQRSDWDMHRHVCQRS